MTSQQPLTSSQPNTGDELQRLLDACRAVPYLATCIHETIQRAGLKLVDAAADDASLKAALGKCITALMFEAENAVRRKDDVALAQIHDAVMSARAALEAKPAGGMGE